MSKSKAVQVYLELRSRFFSGSRPAFGLAPDPSRPWGAVMEMGMEKASVTVVAAADGFASIYLSSGGGFIGGQSHPSIRQAAENMVSTVSQFQGAMLPAAERPLPENGQVIFYALCDNGILAASAPESELMSRKHSLTPLFAAGQEIITQYRLLQEKSKR
jgi:hypothetical protein